MADHRDDPLPSTTRWSASAGRLRSEVPGRPRAQLLFIPILVLVVAVVAAVLVLSTSSPPDELVAVAAGPRPDTSVSAADPPATLATPPTPPPTSAPPRQPLRVALVGDSLLNNAAPAISQALADHDVTDLDGRNGRTIAHQFGTAVAMAARDPDVLVVMLGANDAGPDFTREAMERDVRALLDGVSEVPCIKWVTVQEDFYLPGTEGWGQGTLTLNVTLFREAALRPNLEVIDFAPIINDQSEWHQLDLLHLDNRGNQALADTISESLECTPQPEETAA